MAFSPLSVTHAALSGPTMTPCGAEPDPRGMRWVSPVAGSSRPKAPAPCAVYHTEPSGAGATSCGRDPGGTGYSWIDRAAASGMEGAAGAAGGVASREGGASVGNAMVV